ncbi:MAG: FAD-dependent oxidoreductase [Candidatus Pacebacteria bacterium]|nr:FAD-dependent oxidoreductase [Candidatus Paceibacterota bacterium]MBP9772922.1 FAD-dependent oxidoreductase [Candidatus Paceibacterota bacterium]
MRRINIGIQYDVIIVGAGVGGASLAYVLSNFTSVKHILVLEKGHEIGGGNSHYSQNSQTLHEGDIETNYSLDKSTEVAFATNITKTYLGKFSPEAYRLDQKMVIGVGEKEVLELENRFATIKHLYPKLKKIGRGEIKKLEPNVVEGRDGRVPLSALYTEGYTVDFKKLAKSFLKQSIASGKDVTVKLTTEVQKINKIKGGYRLLTNFGSFSTRTVVFMSGGYSLKFAKELGYAKHWAILPVAGNFYFSNELYLLKGKVYTVQKPKLPFAAVHGDVEINTPSLVRFGPTAKVLPLLERRKGIESFYPFLKTSVWTMKGMISLFKIISDKTLFLYILKNFLYDMPLIGKYFFLQQARKVVPKLQYKDLYFAKGAGGIRHQILNTETGKLEMGEAEIFGEDVVFNIAPSPGASVCLKNSYDYAKKVVEFFEGEFSFDEEAWDEIYSKKEELVS